METLTSVQQPMEFPHLMGVAVQPSEVLYDYVLYRNITSEYYSIGRAKECFYIGSRGCVLWQFIELVMFAHCVFILAMWNITLGGYLDTRRNI